MVEFAFSLPFFLLIMLTILFFGRYFYIKQVVLSACQEAARRLSTSANLASADNRQAITGFDTSGNLVNGTAPVAVLLKGAGLFSGDNLPVGSSVKVLPFDAEGDDPVVQDGTLAVKITYPFNFMAGQGQNDYVAVYSGDDGAPVRFENGLISEIAVSHMDISQ